MNSEKRKKFSGRTSLREMIQAAAAARGDREVPPGFIERALELVEKGRVEVDRYPTGAPTLEGVYRVARDLYEKDSK